MYENAEMRLSLNAVFKYDIPEIDNGHSRIILMINEVGDCLSHGDFDAALRQIIHLIAVERKHAQFENRLLEEHNYTQVAFHRGYHDTLTKVLSDIMEALGDGDQDLSKQLHKKLCTSFLDDLLTADLPFKSLLQHRVLGR